MPKIEIKNLNVTYDKNNQEIVAIPNLSCVFESGKISVIMGESGSGKTSLLMAIIGLVDYVGEINVDDKCYDFMEIKDKNISYVSQKFVLYPFMNVFDNIAFPLKLLKTPPSEIKERVYEIAKILNIELLLTRKPKKLSVGQQQRVALARAMIKNPKIYLFDEVFSNQDEKAVAEQRVFLKKMMKSINATVIFVTHKAKDAMALADNIYIMEKGNIIISGKPNDLYNNDNPKIHAYFEDIDNEIKIKRSFSDLK